MKKVMSFCLILILSSTLAFSNRIKGIAEKKECISLLAEKYCINIISIEGKSIKKKTSYLNLDVDIPVIKDLKDLKFQQELNNQIENKILSFAAKLEEDAKQYEKDAKEKNFPFHPYELMVTYKVNYNNNSLLSYTVDVFYYTGGAHGMTERYAYNIDTRSSKVLELKDLFKETYKYKEAINNEIAKKIKESPEGTYFPNEFKSITDNQVFYITDNGIVIHFGLYEIAPYVSGFSEFTMPWGMFKGNLKYTV